MRREPPGRRSVQVLQTVQGNASFLTDRADVITQTVLFSLKVKKINLDTRFIPSGFVVQVPLSIYVC